MISEHKLRKHRRNEERAAEDIDLRRLVAEVVHSHHLGKSQLVDRVAEILGEPVSLSRFESYTASTKASARLPAYFLRALCEALDSDEILLHLARPSLRKKVEFAETVRELRRISDELLQMPELNPKRVVHSSAKQSKISGKGIPADQRKNGNGSCAP